jgi:hypothetical protein
MAKLVALLEFMYGMREYGPGACIRGMKARIVGTRGNGLVKALCYKPEGRGFETRLYDCNFSIYVGLPATLGPGVYSASNRNRQIRFLGSRAVAGA